MSGSKNSTGYRVAVSMGLFGIVYEFSVCVLYVFCGFSLSIMSRSLYEVIF